MILTHGANSISGGEPPLSAIIDGREYRVTKIGSQLWTTSNYIPSWSPSQYYPMQCKWQGGVSNPSEEIKSKGVFFKHTTATSYINFIKSYLNDGWRIPTFADFNALLNTIGGRDNGYKLLSVDAVGYNKTLTDEYNFSAINYGNGVAKYPYTGDYTWIADGVDGAFFLVNLELSAESNGDYPMHMYISHPSGYLNCYKQSQNFNDYMDDYVPVRLVKDAPVTIGGREYKTVTIGNQQWLAENLDYKFAVEDGTLPIGGDYYSSRKHAWYYNNDEATYGIDGTYKCGLLYNWYAVKYLEDHKSTLLPDGWHVPTSSEVLQLINVLGPNSTVGKKVKAKNNSVTSNWPSNWNGTDDYGFNALPAGIKGNDSLARFGTRAYFWTSSEGTYSGRAANYYFNNDSDYFSTSEGYNGEACSLRLVKN